MPPVKYSVVYADPPWPCCGGFVPNPQTYNSSSHYRCMAVRDICALPVADLLADDAVLLLWTTGRQVREAVGEVIPAWGFQYKTIAFHWLKLTTLGNPAKVMGCHFFNSVEICLFASRGRPMSLKTEKYLKVDSLVMEKRTRHSQKPEEVRERIDRLFPLGRRVELFARTCAEGWDAWGNEVESTPHLLRHFKERTR